MWLHQRQWLQVGWLAYLHHWHAEELSLVHCGYKTQSHVVEDLILLWLVVSEVTDNGQGYKEEELQGGSWQWPETRCRGTGHSKQGFENMVRDLVNLSHGQPWLVLHHPTWNGHFSLDICTLSLLSPISFGPFYKRRQRHGLFCFSSLLGGLETSW